MHWALLPVTMRLLCLLPLVGCLFFLQTLPGVEGVAVGSLFNGLNLTNGLLECFKAGGKCHDWVCPPRSEHIGFCSGMRDYCCKRINWKPVQYFVGHN
nr:beta-defensin 11-like [Cavia porcellus]